MPKNILLATICPQEADIQLAPYYLKAYFLRHSPEAGSVNISILPFSSYEKPDAVVDKIEKHKPQIVGFSCYIWNITAILKIAKTIKETNPAVKILLGGPEVSPRAYHILRSHRYVDVVAIGEGERTFKELVECYLGNLDTLADVDGIAFRKQDRIIRTDKRQEILNLDEISSPYLDKIADIDFKKYTGYVPTETMRGCVYRCHFCYYHKEFDRLRYFSLERVENELKYLLGKTPKGIYLMDPTFNTNRERAKKILKIFIKYNTNTKLHVELRAELLDKEMVDLLGRAKANFIEIGIQSTNPKALKLINRFVDLDAFKKGISLLNKKKIFYEIQFIDGLPGDNYRTLKKGIDWVFWLKPRYIKIMRFMLLPGTYLRRNARRLGLQFSRRPQYYSSQSSTFSKGDLKRTENLRTLMEIIYDKGMLKGSAYKLAGRLNMEFSEILENWDSWMQRQHKDCLNIIKGNRRENGRLGSLFYNTACIKAAKSTGDFLDFLCRKRNSPFSEDLLNSIDKDRRLFLNRIKSRGIAEEKIGGKNA